MSSGLISASLEWVIHNTTEGLSSGKTPGNYQSLLSALALILALHPFKQAGTCPQMFTVLR
jgi:hypothetical protein